MYSKLKIEIVEDGYLFTVFTTIDSIPKTYTEKINIINSEPFSWKSDKIQKLKTEFLERAKLSFIQKT